MERTGEDVALDLGTALKKTGRYTYTNRKLSAPTETSADCETILVRIQSVDGHTRVCMFTET